MDWHEYFITFATLASTKSKDRSTQVGAVIVGPDNEMLATGFNGFPRGIDDDVEERHERPAKYEWTEHAERNALYQAARVGVSLRGCTLYLNWCPVPCSDCARGIIQTGIFRVIGPPIPFAGKGDRWKTMCMTGLDMLEEAGVECLVYDNGNLVPVRHWCEKENRNATEG